MTIDTLLEAATRAIRGADALIITAGAGMGVDSGLPDFRGNQGFWNAYPPYARLGLSFSQLANPRWFHNDPQFAWGFYGHRLNLYRRTRPHGGFALLKKWGEQKKHGYLVFTSNVDGQFQRAGFAPERIVECHGAIDHMQCLGDCGLGIVPADPYQVEVDPETFRAADPLPACPRCKGLLRPNILMFGDGGWDHSRTLAQEKRMNAWLAQVKEAGGKAAIVECGAGTAIPSVRIFGDDCVEALPGSTIVRVNIREPDVAEGHVGLPLGALEALTRIDERLG